MIWKIARKELLSNLLTLRFAVGTVLFLVLSVLFVCVLLGDYREKLEDYDRLVSRNSDELRQLMTYQNLKPNIHKPPEILAIFSKGVSENMGNSARISIGGVPEITSATTQDIALARSDLMSLGRIPEAKSATASKNPFLAVFPVLDVVLIFKLVMSVLAVLVAYDAISGEKEDETLKLTLSNKRAEASGAFRQVHRRHDNAGYPRSGRISHGQSDTGVFTDGGTDWR